ncbi:MAG: type II/IV secretion system protein, partial [Thalassolituus sp.]
MQATKERLITLTTLVADLHRDGLLNDEDHQLALSIRRAPDDTGLHPITLIARQGYRDARTDAKVLTEPGLGEWLAEREGLKTVH